MLLFSNTDPQVGHLGFIVVVLLRVSGEEGLGVLPKPSVTRDCPHVTSIIDFCGGLGSMCFDLKKATICREICANASRA